MPLSKALFVDRTNKRKVPYIDVPVPEYAEPDAPPDAEVPCIRVEELTSDEISQIQEIEFLRMKMETGGAFAKYGSYDQHMVGLSMTDTSTGQRFFKDLTQCRQGLKQMPNKVLQRLLTACSELNRREQKSIDELVKNLEPTPENASGANSPETLEQASGN